METGTKNIFSLLLNTLAYFCHFDSNAEKLFSYSNNAEVGLLNKSSCLAAALGVTKFIAMIVMNLVTLCCGTSGAQCYKTFYRCKL